MLNYNSDFNILFEKLLAEKTKITLGEAVRKVRKARGWQQRNLSSKAGISSSYLCDIEKKRVVPSIQTMEQIGSILTEDIEDYDWKFFLNFAYAKNVKRK